MEYNAEIAYKAQCETSSDNSVGFLLGEEDMDDLYDDMDYDSYDEMMEYGQELYGMELF